MKEIDRIAISGDWHGNTIYAVGAVMFAKNQGAQKIIHTGDFGFWFEESYITKLTEALDEADMDLWFIRGNHDSTDFLKNLPTGRFGVGTVTSRISHIPDGFRWAEFYQGNVISFLGLGGAVSIDRKWRIQEGKRSQQKSYWDDEAIADSDVRKACSKGLVDVLITHDAPTGTYCLPRPFPLAPDLQRDCDESREKVLKVVQATKPLHLWHGHYHYYYTQDLTVAGHTTHVVGLDCDGADRRNNIYMVDLASLSQDVRNRAL